MRRRSPRLLAISDLHVGFAANRDFVESLRPQSDDDWLVVAGDVGEIMAHVEWALTTLKERFSTVVWVPGNHELWTMPSDPCSLRGVSRYELLVATGRRLGVVTPEDEYPVFGGSDGPVLIVPLFLLYDYTFVPPGASSKEDALALAYEAGVVCTDEFVLHPDPYPSREDWCRARVRDAEQRLAARDPALPTVLVSHWPLIRKPTLALRYQQFAPWCGTTLTSTWHLKYRAAAVIYGHLHMPGTEWTDGVRFDEVSVGYPREWQARGRDPALRQVLPPAGD
jgi:3',5'-cyclic AMP phosphodiesterase CpdA